MKGQFTVPSFTKNLWECYEVNLGNEVERPRCSCHDWGETDYLCKHFLLLSKSFHRGHLLKNDPILHIIDTVNQEESCPDPVKNIKAKTKLFIHKDKKKNLIF